MVGNKIYMRDRQCVGKAQRERYLQLLERVREIVAERLPNAAYVDENVSINVGITDCAEWRFAGRSVKVGFLEDYDGPNRAYSFVVKRAGISRSGWLRNTPEEIASRVVHFLTRDDPPEPIVPPKVVLTPDVLRIMQRSGHGSYTSQIAMVFAGAFLDLAEHLIKRLGRSKR